MLKESARTATLASTTKRSAAAKRFNPMKKTKKSLPKLSQFNIE